MGSVVVKRFVIWLATVGFAVSLAAPVVAENRTIHIRHDKGGDLVFYQIKAQVARDLKLNVVIDGLCASACTVLLHLPRSQVCATHRAELQFHRARLVRTVENGNSLLRKANSDMLNGYPPTIRNWIAKRGGLTDRLLKMKPAEVTRHIRTCPNTDLLS